MIAFAISNHFREPGWGKEVIFGAATNDGTYLAVAASSVACRQAEIYL